MNVSWFQSQHDRFALLDRVAQFDFKTQESISFLVGEGQSNYFRVQGNVEVHHPCIGEFECEFKVRMRVYLPPGYLNIENMTEVIKTLYTALEIPDQDTHKARFYASGPKAYVVQSYEVVAYTPVL